MSLACNCVKFARSKVPSLPYDMWTLQDKMRIVNSNIPLVGEVAVMNYAAPWGHMGVVVGVRGNQITIEESNLNRCKIGRRTGTASQLRILGYFRPANVRVPAQTTSGFPKKVRVVVPALMVRSRPTTASPLAGSKRLTRGTVIQVNGVVTGQSVGGNNRWYVSIHKNYVWSGGIR